MLFDIKMSDFNFFFVLDCKNILVICLFMYSISCSQFVIMSNVLTNKFYDNDDEE